MTQDTGTYQEPSYFNRVAMHILTGAAAGYSAGNAGEAINRGANVGLALQNSYLKEKQFNADQEDRQKFNDLRERSANLDIEYKEKRLKLMDGQQEREDYFRKMDMFGKLSSQHQVGYRKDYISRATGPSPTDGLTYPLNEKQALEVDNLAKGSSTLSDIDMLVYAMHEAETSNSSAVKKDAKFTSDVLGMKHGISIQTASDGKTRFIKTPHGSFPLELASADKIKKVYEENVNASRQKIEDMYRSRNRAASSAQKFMLGQMSDMGLALDPKQSITVAEQYSNEIASNPVMSRAMEVGNALDRIVKNKDEEFTAMEKAEFANVLKKAGVKHHMNAQTGEYYIDVKALNEYMNFYNPGEPVDMFPVKGMVKVDEGMIQDIFNNSGLNSLAERYRNEAKSISDMRVRSLENEARTKLSGYEAQKRIDAQVDIEKGMAEREAVNASKVEQIVKKNDWTGATADDVMNAYQFNAQEREMFEDELAGKMSKTFAKDNIKLVKDKYKELTGRELNKDEELNSTAIGIIKSLPEFQKQFNDDPKSRERLSKTILRRMATPEFRRRKAAETLVDGSWKDYSAEQEKKNTERLQQRKSYMDELLEDGGN